VKFPHVPHRRDGDNQLMRETDDILLIFHCLDEHKLLDKLPRYVSDGPDNMPSARLYEGELNTVMRILDSLKKKMAEQGAVLSKVSRDVQEIQVGYVSQSQSTTGRLAPVFVDHTGVLPGPGPSFVSISDEATGGISNRWETVSTRQDRNDWALMASTPTPVPLANRYAALSTDDDDRSEHAAGEDQAAYTTVVRRSTKRQRPRATPPPPQPQRQQQQQHSTTEQSRRQRRAPTVFGTSSTARAGNIVAAKKLYKKAIYCIDNVSTSCTVDNIRRFVSGLSVDVWSCFEVKPRRRPDEDEESVTDRKAFRLCINEAHSAKLLNGSAWPESITISEWLFKPASSAGDGKRRRLSGSRTVTVEARSSDSGGSGADAAAAVAAAAADTAVIIANEPAADAADAAVDDADRSAVASDDTVVIMEISNLQEDGN